jgi:hypothetical protein
LRYTREALWVSEGKEKPPAVRLRVLVLLPAHSEDCEAVGEKFDREGFQEIPEANYTNEMEVRVEREK